MKNSPAVSTMVAADQNTRDLVEEDVGLACPPFDDEDFMAAEASFFDLSEKVFFSGVEGDQKGAERFQGSSGNLNAVQILQKKHGRGKNMKVLEQVYKHKDIAPKDTKAETIESDKKTSTKAAIVDDEVSFENRINLAKRKLQESYANIGQEKKRRQIQVLSLSELPQVKCRPGKHRVGLHTSLLLATSQLRVAISRFKNITESITDGRRLYSRVLQWSHGRDGF